VVARLDRHQIQHPVFSMKAEVKSVQQQNQRPYRQAHNTRSGHKPPQGLTVTIAHRLMSKASTRCQVFQGSSSQQDCFQKPRRTSPTLGASFLCADAPRSLALTALTTARSKAVNFCSATRRFRVRGIHARELSTDSRSKHGKSLSYFA
jgi:hypothetical protein